MEKILRKYANINIIKKRLKKKSTIFKYSVCLIVIAFLLITYNYGKSNNFGINDIKFTNSNTLSVSKTYNEQLETVTSVVLKWNNGDIIINKSNDDKFSVTESSESQLSNAQSLVFEQNKNELVIKFNSEYGFINSPVQMQKNIQINLPSTVKNLEIKTVRGDINIDKMEFQKLSIKTDNSNMTLKNCISEKVDLKLKSGSLTIDDLLVHSTDISSKNANQSLTKLVAESLTSKSQEGDISIIGNIHQADVSSVYGDINLKSNMIIENLSLSNVAGDITASVPENEGFIFEHNIGLGDMAVVDFVIKDNEEISYYKDLNSVVNYSFQTSKGSINLLKESFTSNVPSYQEYIEQKYKETEE